MDHRCKTCKYWDDEHSKEPDLIALCLESKKLVDLWDSNDNISAIMTGPNYGSNCPYWEQRGNGG
jgi:general stress protein 26